MNPFDFTQLFARQPLSVYLLGAGGQRMCALGHLLLDLGAEIHGSDLLQNGHMDSLQKRGAQLGPADDGTAVLLKNPHLLVYSSSIRLNNPELQAAQGAGIPIIHRSTLLAALMKRQRGLCLVGQYGKNLAAALLLFAMKRLQRPCSYCLGGSASPGQLPGRYAATTEDLPWFIADLDEREGNLLQFFPQTSIFLPIESPGDDYFQRMETVDRDLARLGAQTSQTILYSADDARLASLFQHGRNAVSFGLNPGADYSLAGWKSEGKGSSFDVWKKEQKIGAFRTDHLEPADAVVVIAVIAFLHQLGYSAEAIASVVLEFTGPAGTNSSDAHKSVMTESSSYPGAAALFRSRLSSETIFRLDEPLARKTTLRVGGNADFYFEPAQEEDLAIILRSCHELQMPFLILGRGSNLLIRDGGIRGAVICLARPSFSTITAEAPEIHCGAGARLKTISNEARRHGISGLEFLEGIPGSVGGAMRMNAGAMGSWMFDVVRKIRFMDYQGGIHERLSAEVNVEYRGCPLFKNHIALGAVLKGEPASKLAIEQKMRSWSEKRWSSQPAAPSAGCIFKNPGVIPAGKLIDELGLKGTRVGGAVVSDVHGNFIVNDGHATARDILNLIEIIQQRVRTARGIELHPEVQIIGEN